MTNRRGDRILIAGGGIAGMVAAIALRKAGFRPVVAEGHGRDADGVGAFLTLAPNGVRGLRELGLHGVLEPGFATARFVISLGSGRVLTEMDATAAAALTIRRADLYTGLREHAQAQGIVVEYGKRLVDAEVARGGAVARFEDGSQMRGDLLVGADGIHSRLRTVIDPRAAKPRWLGLLNTGGFARGVDVHGPHDAFNFVFGRRCFFGWGRHPSGEVWWFANPGRAKEPSRAELAAIDPAAWRAELVELASVDASPMTKIIEATPEILPPWPTHDLPSVRTWWRDRMILLGDAAHAASPSSGQGASMAIEDGLVLAKCLRDVSPVEHALEAYEQLRRGRVERVVAQGRRNGTGKTPGPLGRVVRDAMLSIVFPLMKGRDPMAWLHADRLEWQTPVAYP